MSTASAQAESPALHRVASLDLLRGIAAFSVVIPHFFVYNGINQTVCESISSIAVEIFFVLSGFVLSSQIILCLNSGASRNIYIFLYRRWMRTIPPYLIALLSISILYNQFLTADFFKYMLYIQNFAFLSVTLDYYQVSWSLSVEEWYYILFPLLLVAASSLSRRTSPGWHCLVAVGFIVFITVLRSTVGNFDNWGQDVRRCVIFRIDSIAYGFVLYFLLSQIRPSQHTTPGQIFQRGLAVSALGAATVTLIYSIGAQNAELAKHLFPIIAPLFGATLIWFMLSLDGLIARWPSFRSFCYFLGQISYSAYLFHIVIAVVVNNLLAGYDLAPRFLVYIAVAILFCWFFYHTFEKPILAARPSFLPRRRSPPATSLAPETPRT